MQTKIIFVTLLFVLSGVRSKPLEALSDDALLEFIKEQEKLIVLFTKQNCDTCKEMESRLESLESDFAKQMKAVTVKVINSQMTRLYNPSKEPVIVFFRHGVPLLFDADTGEDDMYGYFEKNQKPAVKELSDNIFEHMTQAATGATTGDWFVMFYSASCVDCQKLHAVWETVGAKLRGRINVARIDAGSTGLNTGKRFKVNQNDLPAFLFFRLGKVYRYDLPKTDVKSFLAFAQDWYRNTKGETVPILPSPFDEFVDSSVKIIKKSIAFGLDILAEHPWIWQIGIFGFGLVAITAIIALMKAGKSKQTKDPKKDKKSK